MGTSSNDRLPKLHQDEVKNDAALLPEDRLIRLTEVPALLEKITGARVHVASVYRWVQRGCKGVFLETEMLGCCEMTCERWVREFRQKTTAAAKAARHRTPPSEPSRDRKREREQAKRELDRAGI